MKNYTYSNANIEVTFDQRKCCHAAHCFKELPDVFDGDIDPPIRPDNASVEEIIRVVEMCPSSALTYRCINPSYMDEQTPAKNEAVMSPRSPLFLRGDFLVKNEGQMNRVALCRCGASKSKPFCDGSHFGIKFKGPAEAAEDDITEFESTGQVKLTPIENGPVAFSGKLTFKTRTGSVQYCREKGALCRCGASENKPFCDAKHREIEFSTNT